jgi:hypothetical protein
MLRAARLIALFAALYPEGVRVTNASGWLLFTAYAFWEPDEEVTPEDIVTIKLLVAAWPESANIPPSMIQMIQMIQTIQMKVTQCTMSSKGARRAAATSSAYARLRASAATLCELNYPHRRAMLALLFCKIPVRDIPLVMGLRQLKGYRREGHACATSHL